MANYTNVTQVLGRIFNKFPEKQLRKLGKDCKADWNVSKLNALDLLWLLVYGNLDGEPLSQRMLATTYNKDIHFRSLANIETGSKIVHSALSARLSMVPVAFFQKAFGLFRQHFKGFTGGESFKQMGILRVDSTIVSDVTGRIQECLRHGRGTPQVKFTLSADDLGPKEVILFTDNTAFNEDNTLPVAVQNIGVDEREGVIATFDRGISSRKTYTGFTQDGISFVTRVRTNSQYEVLKVMNGSRGRKMGGLKVLSEQVVLLKTGRRKCPTPLRLIQTIELHSTKPLWFLTNRFDLTTKDVLQIYKRRWDIEVLFRFLKQELNFEHLLSLNKNGMLVSVYAMLMSSILVLGYKKTLEVGFRDARRMMVKDIEFLVLTMLIIRFHGKYDDEVANFLAQLK